MIETVVAYRWRLLKTASLFLRWASCYCLLGVSICPRRPLKDAFCDTRNRIWPYCSTLLEGQFQFLIPDILTPFLGSATNVTLIYYPPFASSSPTYFAVEPFLCMLLSAFDIAWLCFFL